MSIKMGRTLQVETLESREMLSGNAPHGTPAYESPGSYEVELSGTVNVPHSSQPAHATAAEACAYHLDVDSDWNVTPIDALFAIGGLADQGPVAPLGEPSDAHLDVNKDGYKSALDPLKVIHGLNTSPGSLALGIMDQVIATELDSLPSGITSERNRINLVGLGSIEPNDSPFYINGVVREASDSATLGSEFTYTFSAEDMGNHAFHAPVVTTYPLNDAEAAPDNGVTWGYNSFQQDTHEPYMSSEAELTVYHGGQCGDIQTIDPSAWIGQIQVAPGETITLTAPDRDTRYVIVSETTDGGNLNSYEFLVKEDTYFHTKVHTPTEDAALHKIFVYEPTGDARHLGTIHFDGITQNHVIEDLTNASDFRHTLKPDHVISIINTGLDLPKEVTPYFHAESRGLDVIAPFPGHIEKPAQVVFPLATKLFPDAYGNFEYKVTVDYEVKLKAGQEDLWNGETGLIWAKTSRIDPSTTTVVDLATLNGQVIEVSAGGLLIVQNTSDEEKHFSPAHLTADGSPSSQIPHDFYLQPGWNAIVPVLQPPRDAVRSVINQYHEGSPVQIAQLKYTDLGVGEVFTSLHSPNELPSVLEQKDYLAPHIIGSNSPDANFSVFSAHTDGGAGVDYVFSRHEDIDESDLRLTLPYFGPIPDVKGPEDKGQKFDLALTELLPDGTRDEFYSGKELDLIVEEKITRDEIKVINVDEYPDDSVITIREGEYVALGGTPTFSISFYNEEDHVVKMEYTLGSADNYAIQSLYSFSHTTAWLETYDNHGNAVRAARLEFC